MSCRKIDASMVDVQCFASVAVSIRVKASTTSFS